MDDSRPWLPSEPLSWAHRGPGWPDCSQAPSHCPIVRRPSEKKGLAVGPGWRERGPAPALLPLLGSLDRQDRGQEGVGEGCLHPAILPSSQGRWSCRILRPGPSL